VITWVIDRRSADHGNGDLLLLLNQALVDVLDVRIFLRGEESRHHVVQHARVESVTGLAREVLIPVEVRLLVSGHVVNGKLQVVAGEHHREEPERCKVDHAAHHVPVPADCFYV